MISANASKISAKLEPLRELVTTLQATIDQAEAAIAEADDATDLDADDNLKRAGATAQAVCVIVNKTNNDLLYGGKAARMFGELYSMLSGQASMFNQLHQQHQARLVEAEKRAQEQARAAAAEQARQVAYDLETAAMKARLGL